MSAAPAPASFRLSKAIFSYLSMVNDTQQAKIFPGSWNGIKSAALLDEEDEEDDEVELSLFEGWAFA